MKEKYDDEEKVVIYYAYDSDLCTVLSDEKAQEYLKQYEEFNQSVV